MGFVINRFLVMEHAVKNLASPALALRMDHVVGRMDVAEVEAPVVQVRFVDKSNFIRLTLNLGCDPEYGDCDSPSTPAPPETSLCCGTGDAVGYYSFNNGQDSAFVVSCDIMSPGKSNFIHDLNARR